MIAPISSLTSILLIAKDEGLGEGVIVKIKINGRLWWPLMSRERDGKHPADFQSDSTKNYPAPDANMIPLWSNGSC